MRGPKGPATSRRILLAIRKLQTMVQGVQYRDEKVMALKFQLQVGLARMRGNLASARVAQEAMVKNATAQLGRGQGSGGNRLQIHEAQTGVPRTGQCHAC